jgi:calcium-dependent protein kinase
MFEGVGTIYTMAPQVLQGLYTSQADLWSVGVISYMLLCGEMPFSGRKRRNVIDKIMRGDYTFRKEVSERSERALSLRKTRVRATKKH